MDRYEHTLSAIRQLLDDGPLAGDGRLPTERELSEKLSVGRRTLRRALGALEQQGLIVRRQGRGTFAVGYTGQGASAAPAHTRRADALAFGDIANPIELIEMRLALEPTMCRLAALRSSRRDVERLRQLAADTEQASDHQAYEKADNAFHRGVAELSRNSLFVQLHAAVSTALRDEALERFGETGHCYKRQSQHVDFHRAIVEAIAARDCDRAECLMHEHLSDVHRSLFADAMPAASISRRLQSGETPATPN